MKKCPTCNRTFTDDVLSFCLDDGSPLLSTGTGSDAGSNDPGATLMYTPPRDTNPPPPPTPSYTSAQYPNQQPQQPAWSPTPQVGMGRSQAQPPPKKSNKAIWIVGVIAAVVVIGIGGIILLVVLAGMSESNTNNSNSVSNNSNSNSNSNTTANSNANEANDNTDTDPPKNYQVQEDFSNTTKWLASSNEFGKTEYVNGEYQLSSATNGRYVIIYGPKTAAYYTENATSRVTVRSVSGISPSLGFGLTVYSELKNDNLEDYAFLIRTGDSPAFRVALHQAGKESELVVWTASSLIRTGTSPNQLEVRANGDQLEFYINGQYATSVTDSAGYKHGLVGFYSSDTTPVAFDDLEIYK